MPSKRHQCDYVDHQGLNRCQDEAEWEVWFASGIDDYFFACRKHLVDLLTPEDEHRLFRIPD